MAGEDVGIEEARNFLDRDRLCRGGSCYVVCYCRDTYILDAQLLYSR
jgi:hypothetical protein